MYGYPLLLVLLTKYLQHKDLRAKQSSAVVTRRHDSTSDSIGFLSYVGEQGIIYLLIIHLVKLAHIIS